MKHIVEAYCYLDNAKDILSTKAQKEDGFYLDKKYVKMAGHTAYTGLLVALDGYFGNKKKGRKNVEWYQGELAKIDKKISYSFSTAYTALHLDMGYDGSPSVVIANEGFRQAEKIINWIEIKQEVVI